MPRLARAAPTVCGNSVTVVVVVAVIFVTAGDWRIVYEGRVRPFPLSSLLPSLSRRGVADSANDSRVRARERHAARGNIKNCSGETVDGRGGDADSIRRRRPDSVSVTSNEPRGCVSSLLPVSRT